MKKLFLGLFVGTMVIGATNVFALECGGLPDCADLGYTLTEDLCEGHTMVRCPFDTSKVFCGVTCQSLGYRNTGAIFCQAGQTKKICPIDASYFKCEGIPTSSNMQIGGNVAQPKTCSDYGYYELLTEAEAYCTDGYTTTTINPGGSSSTLNIRITCYKCNETATVTPKSCADLGYRSKDDALACLGGSSPVIVNNGVMNITCYSCKSPTPSGTDSSSIIGETVGDRNDGFNL